MEDNEITVKDYIEDLYKIKNKKGQLIKLKFNFAQNEIYDKLKDSYGKKPSRFIILKARQLGISTLSEALITYLATNSPNTDAVILAHTSESSSKIYEMTQLFVDCLPEGLKPKQKYSNRKMLSFDDENNGLKSSIRVMVANDSTRGGTYRLAHLSEVAFWEKPDEALLALNQAVPMTNDSLIIMESTANGFNYFYNLWQDAVNGRNDFVPIFLPWYVDPAYSIPYKGFEKTSYEKDIQERFNLTDDQLQWRRWCIANNCRNDEMKFRQEYPITPEEAFITSGTSVFNNDIILEHMKHVLEPIRVGYFEYDYNGTRISNIRFIDDSRGYIKLYKEPTGASTVIGGDTAGDGEDFFVAQVLDADGFLCATLHHKFDEDVYTKQVYCLGMYYKSLIAIEANFSTFPNMELQRLKYPHIYIREKYDRILKDVQPKFGFKTTVLTRPIIISQLVEIVREHVELINDKETLQEMLSFVKLKGKPQASEGTHDDLVMGLAIAYEALKQLPRKFAFKEFSLNEVENKGDEKTNEELEFFNYGL